MRAHALQSLDGQSSEQTLGRLKLPSPHPMPELTFDRRGYGALTSARKRFCFSPATCPRADQHRIGSNDDGMNGEK